MLVWNLRIPDDEKQTSQYRTDHGAPSRERGSQEHYGRRPTKGWAQGKKQPQCKKIGDRARSWFVDVL